MRVRIRNCLSEIRKLRNIKQISIERFNAYVDWTRAPFADNFSSELDWYSDTNERVLGAVVFDNIDGDYGYVVLGRDKARRFRCIDLKVSMRNVGMARSRLKKALLKYSETGRAIFPQADEVDFGINLFDPVVPEFRWHASFRVMMTTPHWQPAIGIMSEMMHHFVDVDKHFVKEFQTNGFDARMWELYLYAYFREERLFVGREHHAPDYVVSKYDKKIAIEAVTVNPTDGAAPIKFHDGEPFFRTQTEIDELLANQVPIRISSTLTTKLKKTPAYWTLKHTKGLPLVFALADFHESQSMTWSFPAVLQYLYGIKHDISYDSNGVPIISALKIDCYTKDNGSKVQAGFFFLAETENISAVLFSNSGTLAKFNRMGRLADFGDGRSAMFRAGVCHDHDPEAILPRPFNFEIAPGKVKESWSEGLSMFHNPKAKYPVPQELFPSIAHHEFRDDKIFSVIPEFHPYASMTTHLRPLDEPE